MLMRFDPFADFDRLARQMTGEGRLPVLAADAYRLDDRFYLHLDLPGIDPETIDVAIEKNTLTISAERAWDTPEGAQVLMRERGHGRFQRQFFLGDALDTDAIEAGYDHGVLTLTVPVAEKAKPRRIVVGAGDKALSH